MSCNMCYFIPGDIVTIDNSSSVCGDCDHRMNIDSVHTKYRGLIHDNGKTSHHFDISPLSVFRCQNCGSKWEWFQIECRDSYMFKVDVSAFFNLVAKKEIQSEGNRKSDGINQPRIEDSEVERPKIF